MSQEVDVDNSKALIFVSGPFNDFSTGIQLREVQKESELGTPEATRRDRTNQKGLFQVQVERGSREGRFDTPTVTETTIQRIIDAEKHLIKWTYRSCINTKRVVQS